MSVPAVQSNSTVPARTPGAVALWRSLLAGLAWWGVLAALDGDPGQLRYFSQVTTLAVALVATASVLTWSVTAPWWLRVLAWCRGAATTYAIVTAVIYQRLLSGDLTATSSLLEHAVVPILAVLDWVVFGPQRVRQAWWTPLTWLIPPIGYLAVYYHVRDRTGKPLYPFLNPAAGDFWTLGGDHGGGVPAGGFSGVGSRSAAPSRPAAPAQGSVDGSGLSTVEITGPAVVLASRYDVTTLATDAVAQPRWQRPSCWPSGPESERDLSGRPGRGMCGLPR